MALPEPSNSLQPELIERQPRSLATGARIGLWFGCLLVVLFVFSLVLGGTGFLFVFWVAAIFAVPVACLYLPLVVKLQDAEQLRWLVLIGVGALIGPVALAGLSVVQVLTGHDPRMVWVGEGEDVGFAGLWPCAVIVGALTSALYAGSLKIARRW